MRMLFLCTSVLLAHGFTRTESRAPCSAWCDRTRPNDCTLCAAGEEGAPCGRRRDPSCTQGLECMRSGQKNYSRGVCRCKSGYPVCGSDGRKYRSLCKMQAASRRAQDRGLAPITQSHKNECAPESLGPAHPNSPRFKFNFIADVVEKIAPAVVHIELFISHPLFGRHVPLSSGSGFIVTESGVIVTNAHVVSSNAAAAGRQQLRVELQNGKTYEASITAIDQKADIATIRINPRNKLPVLPLGRSADLRPGEFVVAIGSPFALQNTVTTGIVSTAQRDGKELGIHDSDIDYVQTDAIINYGNSGGPLVNLDGEVIGINTLKVTAGISFAIPSDRINRFLEESHDKQYKSKHRLVRLQYTPPQPAASDIDVKATTSFLGIRMTTLTESLVEDLKHRNPHFPDISSGILIHEVLPDSPAQMGGLETNDVIVKLNGRPLHSTDDLQLAIRGGTSLLLEVYRGEDRLLFNIKPRIFME